MKKTRKYQFNSIPEEFWVTPLHLTVEERINFLTSAITEIEKENAQFPNGKIRAYKHNHSFQYFWRKNKDDKLGQYLKETEIDFARQIIQHEYNEKILKYAKHELYLLNNVNAKLSANTYIDIYNSFSEGKRRLISPILSPEDDFIKQWEAKEYKKNGFPFGENEFYTDKEERVRSKSEILIANTLNKYRIPYKYEYPISIDGTTKFADFLILNIHTRKEIVFEHFGMMDNIGYAVDNIDKINRYIMNGYIPGDNFIYIQETSRTPLNTQIVEKMIQHFFL